MMRFLVTFVIWLGLGLSAVAQTNFPQVMPPGTVYGNSTPQSGPGVAIPFSVIIQNLNNQPNTWGALQTLTAGVKSNQYLMGNSAFNLSPVDFEPVTPPPGYTFDFPAFVFADGLGVGLSFADTATHYAAQIQGSKVTTAGVPSGTGSYAGLITLQFCQGSSNQGFCTGSIEQVLANFNTNSAQNSGNFTANNPITIVPAISGCSFCGNMSGIIFAVGEEIDTAVYQTVNKIEGLRIANLNFSAGGTHGAGTGAWSVNQNTSYLHMLKSTGATGFPYGIMFASDWTGSAYTDANFPVGAGGAGIFFSAPSVSLYALVDGSGLGGGCSVACFMAPANNPGLWFGAAGAGGKINSATVSGGPSITFNNGNIAISAPVSFGITGTTAGFLVLAGATTGVVAIQTGAANAGTFNFNLPVTSGSAGNVLASGGGGAAPMTWITGVTTVCTVTAGNSLTFTNGVLTTKGANCT